MTTDSRTTVETTDFVGPTGNATPKYEVRNPLTRALLRRFLREVDATIVAASPSSILDVGCGEGVVTERLAKVSGAPIVGIDLGDDALRAEWERRESERVSFQAASAYELPFEDDSFDCVCAIEVLEHLERPSNALAEMARVARRTLLLSVPREPFWRASHVLAGRDVRQLGNTPGHINHWSSRDFERFVAGAGDVRRMRRPFPWTIVLASPRLHEPPARGDRVVRPSEHRTSSRSPAAPKTHRHALRVLYFGTYERHYPRNAQVISSLRSAGVHVVESHVPVWEDQQHKFGLGARSAARLASAELRLLRRQETDFDVMIVGYPGHFDMPRARRVAGRRPLVFNPLLSLYDSVILDRGRWGDGSIPARVLRAVDRRAMRLADLTVADTKAHADYFACLADIDRGKVEVCLLGAEEPLFQAGWRRSDDFYCLFFGKMIPLHGLDVIIEAARLAPEIEFRIAGTGQLEGLLESNLPGNVHWLKWIDHDRIPKELWAAGCSLGIFGTTEKASRVIPNKAYEALACGTPLVTSDTKASRELLVDGKSALLVPPGDAQALANAVRRIARDAELANGLSDGGLAVYRERASEAVLGQRWRGVLEQTVRLRS